MNLNDLNARLEVSPRRQRTGGLHELPTLLEALPPGTAGRPTRFRIDEEAINVNAVFLGLLAGCVAQHDKVGISVLTTENTGTEDTSIFQGLINEATVEARTAARCFVHGFGIRKEVWEAALLSQVVKVGCQRVFS